MAKKKTTETKKAETTEEIKKPTVWDQILESVTEENKEGIIKELTEAAEFLEKNEGDPELIAGFKSTLKKIK